MKLFFRCSSDMHRRQNVMYVQRKRGLINNHAYKEIIFCSRIRNTVSDLVSGGVVTEASLLVLSIFLQRRHTT